MNHSIPRPPDEEPSKQRELSASKTEELVIPSAAEIAAEQAFRAWLTPEKIRQYKEQHIASTAKGVVASGATPRMAREHATALGYGSSDAFIFQVYPGLLREIGCEESPKVNSIVNRARLILRKFLP